MNKLLIMIALALTTSAQPRAIVPSDTARVVFRQSSVHLDMDMGRNRESIDSVAQAISNRKHVKINAVRITGGASPEGSVALNRYLSDQRAGAILKAVEARVKLPDSLIRIESVGRDWSGLRYEAGKCADVPYRAEVLTLLDTIANTPEPSHPDNLSRLKSLRGGIPYAFLYKNIFPGLRESRIIVDYTQLPPVRMIDMPRTDSLVLPVPPVPTMWPVPDLTPDVPACRPLYLALKTNLLYDAAALPSIGAEAYVGKGWSVVANWTYGWWDNDREHRYWRAYGGDLAVRRWFGRRAAEKPLTGHHLGVYAGVVTYDFEFGGKGHMGGLPGRNLWDRCNVMAGIEYGYSLPVARRLNIDFTIGLGYLGGKVITYKPSGDFYIWQKTSRLNWVGPTKLEVSLVWLIGCDNFNRKGGRK